MRLFIVQFASFSRFEYLRLSGAFGSMWRNFSAHSVSKQNETIHSQTDQNVNLFHTQFDFSSLTRSALQSGENYNLMQRSHSRHVDPVDVNVDAGSSEHGQDGIAVAFLDALFEHDLVRKPDPPFPWVQTGENTRPSGHCKRVKN